MKHEIIHVNITLDQMQHIESKKIHVHITGFEWNSDAADPRDDATKPKTFETDPVHFDGCNHITATPAIMLIFHYSAMS